VNHEREVDALYDVVVNIQGQYSILAVNRPVPEGWRSIGVRGTRDACLDHIESIWTDMQACGQ
jgi:MbtH protein